MLRQRQALKILRGARELLNRRARELREQALHALQLVQKADAAEVGVHAWLWCKPCGQRRHGPCIALFELSYAWRSRGGHGRREGEATVATPRPGINLHVRPPSWGHVPCAPPQQNLTLSTWLALCTPCSPRAASLRVLAPSHAPQFTLEPSPRFAATAAVRPRRGPEGGERSGRGGCGCPGWARGALPGSQ